jgi:predicted transposase YdaD
VRAASETLYEKKFPQRLLRYNVLLSYRHELPVHSVAVLLCRAADGPELTGVLNQRSPDGAGRCRLEFHYQVVRVWELDVAQLLAGGIGTLPLAPLAARTDDEMPAIVAALMRRVDPKDTSADVKEFWTAVGLLAGLRYPWESIKHWFAGVTAMTESSMYQGLLQEGRAEGRAEGARRILLRQGELRFGPADAAARTTLETIADLEQLERLSECLLTASSWAELLAES